MSQENNIQEQVLQKIRAGAVSKRPRFYFVAQIALVALVALGTLLLSIFVLSFIVFSIHESGERFLLGFGQQGLVTLLALFPWFTLLLVVVLLLALEWLLHYFKFGYRIPILRIFLGIAALAAAGSIAINFTPLHRTLQDKADHDSLPVLGPAYEDLHESHQPQGAFRGIVISIATSTFVISHNDRDQDKDDGSWTIEPPGNFDMHSISVGDDVFVGGLLKDGVVHAFGVQKFPPQY